MQFTKPGAKSGYLAGVAVSLLSLIILFLPGQEAFHTLGPANTGHENLACQTCHEDAPGTARQQIQANARYWLGLRQSPVDFGHKPVENSQCLACHDRPNDYHPVFRFNEPRFAEARASIQPQLCASCHLEHQGIRVTIDTQFCIHCHQDLSLKNDPIDISHQDLITAGNWDSCLQCHDFHGNHVMALETVVENALPIEAVIRYFEGAPSPYSNEKLYFAKENLND